MVKNINFFIKLFLSILSLYSVLVHLRKKKVKIITKNGWVAKMPLTKVIGAKEKAMTVDKVEAKAIKELKKINLKFSLNTKNFSFMVLLLKQPIITKPIIAERVTKIKLELQSTCPKTYL